MIWWILRIVLVIALLCVAAALATPRGRLPLALRGLQRIIARDHEVPSSAAPPVRQSAAKRFAAFLLVLLAVLVAVI